MKPCSPTPSPIHPVACLLPAALAAIPLGQPVLAQKLATPAATQFLQQLPARFIPNMGQWDSPERYRVHVGGLEVFLEPRGWSFWLRKRSAVVPPGAWFASEREDAAPTHTKPAIAMRMTFQGTRVEQPVLVSGDRLSGHSNYLIAADPRRHRTQVPAYASVRYERVYEGIDVILREGECGLEYDLLVAPGADLTRVCMHVEGAKALRIDEAGSLLMQTEVGEIRQPRPQTWMVGENGERKPLGCDFVLRDPMRFGFSVPDRDPRLPLVIDPPLLYATYLGGNGDEQPANMRQDSNGRIFLCGRTYSTNFPTTTGAWSGGTDDGFVTCIDPAQPPANQLVFSTFLGGNSTDVVNDLEPRAGGLVSFCGATASTNLNTSQGAFQSTYGGGGRDGWLGLLRADGSIATLSYLGGSGTDVLHFMRLGTNGECVFAGHTDSVDFPTTSSAFSRTLNGVRDGLIAQMDLGATALLYSTYLGGSGVDALSLGYVDSAGITAIGETSSVDFPVRGPAFDATFNGGGLANRDCVLLRLDPAQSPPANQLVYSTYLGGNSDERPKAAHPAANGTIVVIGTTASSDFPTSTDSYQPRFQGGASSNANGYIAGDAFVVRIDPSKAGAAGMVFGTFLGGGAQDQGIDGCIDRDGVVTLVGWTQANTVLGVPTTPDAMRRGYALNDGFVSRLSADGRQLLYGSLCGGTSHDGAWLATRHSDGTVDVAGVTSSLDLPTRNPLQPTHAGGANDAFAMRLALIPTGTIRFGAATAGSAGVPTIHALGDAEIGNKQFGFACSRAPANGPGVLLVAATVWSGPPLFGAHLHVDPLAPEALLLPVNANAAGEHAWPVGYPPFLLPTIFAQYVWVERLSPFQLSASDALRIH